MKRYLTTVFVFFLATLAGYASATSIGSVPINIRQILGLPAACLPEDQAESIALQSASVSEVPEAIVAPPNGWPSPLQRWAIYLEPGAKPLILRPGECIVFGKPVAGYKQNGETYPLEPGKTYSFGLRRGDRGNRWIPDLYSGSFCVTRSPDGTQEYLPYIHHSNGTMTYPSCGRYAGLPAAPDGFNPPRPASSYPIHSNP